MYTLKGNETIKRERTSFKALKLEESHMEDFIRNNLNIICDEDIESLIVVGQQVRNAKNGVSDLTAIDNEGRIVLIEIKRDKDDILRRKERFEFQAIRYVASYATIKCIEELVEYSYEAYITNHITEFNEDESMTHYDIGIKKIEEFFEENSLRIDKDFNKTQRIILVAGEFDDQTKSAALWLSNNNIDISCYELIPYEIGEEILIYPNKIIPIPSYDYHYVPLKGKKNAKGYNSTGKTKTVLPKIKDMLEWEEIEVGEILEAKGREGKIAYLQENGTVNINREDGENMSMQSWLKQVFGWSTVATYNFAVQQKTKKTLNKIREEHMNKTAIDNIED